MPKVAVFGVTDKQLNKEVEGLRKDFDYVFIDGTPQLSELASRTILASDIVLVPLSPSIYDFRSFESFLQKYEEVKSVKENIAKMEAKNKIVLDETAEMEAKTLAAKEVLKEKQIELSVYDNEVNPIFKKILAGTHTPADIELLKKSLKTLTDLSASNPVGLAMIKKNIALFSSPTIKPKTLK